MFLHFPYFVSLVIDQKIQKGVVFQAHNVITKDDLFAIQHSKDYELWIDFEEDQYSIESNQLELKNLDEGMKNFHVRMVVKSTEGFVLFALNDISIVGKLKVRVLVAFQSTHRVKFKLSFKFP